MVEIISQPDRPIVFGQLSLIAVTKFGSAASARVLLVKGSAVDPLPSANVYPTRAGLRHINGP